MGNGLDRVSPTCLPTPQPAFRKKLTEAGIQFHSSGTEQREQMTRVTLPPGFGIYCTHDRGDMWSGVLIDATFHVIASISWCSKGTHDNEASMRTPYTDKWIDPTKVTLDGGVYTGVCDDYNEYVCAANAYYEAQFRGAHQDSLDEMHKELMEQHNLFDQSTRLPIEKLEAQSGKERVAGAGLALVQEFSKPFCKKEMDVVFMDAPPTSSSGLVSADVETTVLAMGDMQTVSAGGVVENNSPSIDVAYDDY